MGFPDLPSEVLSQRRRKRMPKGACCWRRILTAPRSRLSPRTSPSPPLRPRQSPNPSHLIKQVWLLLSNPTHLRSLSPLRSSPSVTPSHLKVLLFAFTTHVYIIILAYLTFIKWRI